MKLLSRLDRVQFGEDVAASMHPTGRALSVLDFIEQLDRRDKKRDDHLHVYSLLLCRPSILAWRESVNMIEVVRIDIAIGGPRS